MAIVPFVKVGRVYTAAAFVIVPLPVGATSGEKLTPDCATIVLVATNTLPVTCNREVGDTVPMPTSPAMIAPLVGGVDAVQPTDKSSVYIAALPIEPLVGALTHNP